MNVRTRNNNSDGGSAGRAMNAARLSKPAMVMMPKM